MGWKIIFAPQALADLAVLVRYIAKDNPEAALRVGNELIDRVAVLENFPFLGAPYPKSTGVRRLVSSPYIIFLSAKSRSTVQRDFALLGRAAEGTRFVVSPKNPRKC